MILVKQNSMISVIEVRTQKKTPHSYIHFKIDTRTHTHNKTIQIKKESILNKW